MEKIDPGFLARVLGQLPGGVIVVSGTNGKTTTTKMVVQLLESQGLRVLTNRTGSNFVRGVLASLLTEVSWRGRLDADIAVLELDEAHAVRFIQLVRPRACLLLNVMRDQLDRFGEIDYTASLLRRVAEATREIVVTNADDPRLGSPAFTRDLTARVVGFGVGRELADLFLSDDDLRTGHASSTEDAHGDAEPGGSDKASTSAQPGASDVRGERDCLVADREPGQGGSAGRTSPTGEGEDAGKDGEAARTGHPQQTRSAREVRQAGSALLPVRVRLEALTGHQARLSVDGADHEVTFRLPGIHNQLNACAALALVLELLGTRAHLPSLLTALERIEPAFGRGEVVQLDGHEVEISLVKNPAGFRMGLLTAAQAQAADGPETVMIAINDEYADGRDMSWLWDVDFSALRRSGVAVVTGVRAWDMALRLAYEEVPVGEVVPDLDKALAALRQAAASNTPTPAISGQPTGSRTTARTTTAPAASLPDNPHSAPSGPRLGDPSETAQAGVLPAASPEVAGDLVTATDPVPSTGHDPRRVRIFTTYTAMLALRRRLSALTEVEEVMK